MTRRRPWIRFIERLFFTVAVCALGAYAWAEFDTQNFEASATQRFEAQLARLLSKTSQPNPPPLARPAAGDVVGRLLIPRFGLSTMVVEGIESRLLLRAAGHIPGTALPGEDGNIGIAGHRDRQFRPLRDIREGDQILLQTLSGTLEYRVKSTTVVGPEAVEVLAPTAQRSLTLVTCWPFSYLGQAPFRFIVRAEWIRTRPAASLLAANLDASGLDETGGHLSRQNSRRKTAIQ